MRISTQICVGGSKRFFYLSFGDGFLEEYFKLNFNLMYHHKFDITIFENMIPWEKDIYVNLLAKRIREEEERRKLLEMENRSKRRRK